MLVSSCPQPAALSVSPGSLLETDEGLDDCSGLALVVKSDGKLDDCFGLASEFSKMQVDGQGAASQCTDIEMVIECGLCCPMEDEIGDDGTLSKSLSSPYQPTQLEIEDHEVSHIPYRS